MDFRVLFPPKASAAAITASTNLQANLCPGIPGLEFHAKRWFDEVTPALQKWGQNILLLGQSNMGKSYFMKKLLAKMRPERLYVISNTSADQYKEYVGSTKHYAVMPEDIGETEIKPYSYVIIDDIRVMNLKCGTQRECLYKFFTMYSHHHHLNVFFLSQSFDNIKDMKVNTNFLYLFRFTDKSNVKRFIDTLFGGKGNKPSLIFRLYEKLLDRCERPVLGIDCTNNKFCYYCDDQSVAVDFQ